MAGPVLYRLVSGRLLRFVQGCAAACGFVFILTYGSDKGMSKAFTQWSCTCILDANDVT